MTGRLEQMKSVLIQMFKETRKDKGVAGLTVILSIITMLFVIGLLTMIFALMGSELSASTTDPTAQGIINNTTASLSGVPDWFPIIIVIGFMVVLILLTAIIITAIRGTGLMGQGGGVA